MVSLPFIELSLPFKSKEFPNGLMECNVKEGVFEINAHTPEELLQPIHDPSELLHLKLQVTDKVIELLQVENLSPLIRNSLGFRYCKI